MPTQDSKRRLTHAIARLRKQCSQASLNAGMRQPLQGLRFGVEESDLYLERQFRRTPRHKRSNPNDNGDQTQPCPPAGRWLRRRGD